jgi:hypothetical protein
MIAEQDDRCSILHPFGSPVLPEVNITYAVLVGILGGRPTEYACACDDIFGSDALLTTMASCTRDAIFGKHSSDTRACVQLALRQIIANLSAGRDGSSRRKAPPALSTASIATTVHIDFSKQSGTTSSR